MMQGPPFGDLNLAEETSKIAADIFDLDQRS
jgi:hypothetical protein